MSLIINKIFSEKVVILVILINALSIGLETVQELNLELKYILTSIDLSCLTFFILEILLKLTKERFKFFHNPWNIFDFLVISIALIPAAGPLSILRTLRILRAFRVISVIPKLRQVVSGLLASIPGLGAVLGILLVIFYVSSVTATNFFGEAHPEWFGSLGATSYTLFQIMTLESWSMGIVRPIMESHPFAWLFFIPFIFITTFTMLNLFIAVIVNAMQIETEVEATKRAQESQNERLQMLNEIRSLRNEVQKLTLPLKQPRKKSEDHLEL